MTGRRYWLWLTRIKGYGYKKQKALLDFEADPMKLFYMDSEKLSSCFKQRLFNEKDKASFYDSRDLPTLVGYEKRLEALGVGYVIISEANYPWQLKEIYDPPFLLYYRGVLKQHQLSIGVVGSRKCTAYGRKVAEKFGADLGKSGVNVISGLARGIDTYSHLGALDGGGFTTAILGCGINICYPKENVNVMKSIIQKGCVISEYGLDVSPQKGYFPMRNRLISGMSDGLLLIEAKSKSGSLITVDCALEMGKEVFAIPGDVLGGSNQGSNNIIRIGGKPVFSIEDILEEYGQVNEESLKAKGLEEKAIGRLEKEELLVYNQLGQIPVYLDELAMVTKVEVTHLQFLLTKLEIKDLAIQLPGKNYIKA